MTYLISGRETHDNHVEIDDEMIAAELMPRQATFALSSNGTYGTDPEAERSGLFAPRATVTERRRVATRLKFGTFSPGSGPIGMA